MGYISSNVSYAVYNDLMGVVNRLQNEAYDRQRQRIVEGYRFVPSPEGIAICEAIARGEQGELEALESRYLNK
jgi:hypothetical protein